MTISTPVRPSSDSARALSQGTAQCLGESPIRTKNTLSPIESLIQSTPESSSPPSLTTGQIQWTRRSLEDRRGASYSQIGTPWSPSRGSWNAGNREPSVPSLSHSLSAFSLSSTPPPTELDPRFSFASIPFSIPSPVSRTTPRRQPRLSYVSVHTESTGPLGSPFASKVRQYDFPPTMSAFEPVLHTSVSKEDGTWIGTYDRRPTSLISRSSIDDFSSSSTSLDSLARGQDQGDQDDPQWDIVEDQDVEPATRRRLFSSDRDHEILHYHASSSVNESANKIALLSADAAQHEAHGLLISNFAPKRAHTTNDNHRSVTGLGISSSCSSDSENELSPSKPPSRHPRTIISPLGPPRTLPRRKTIMSKPSVPLSPRQRSLRPQFRRGLTEPEAATNSLLSPGRMSTPPSLFAHIRPSPAAFASTGLAKKRSSVATSKPSFGSEPFRRSSDCFNEKPMRSKLGPMTNASTMNDGLPILRAQKARGLRRKTSSMFGDSISSAIEIAPGGSPSTPTKPGTAKITHMVDDITTPSPTTNPDRQNYPFACFQPHQSPLPSRPQLLRLGPIARASNPMLFNSYAQSSPGNRLGAAFNIKGSLGRGEFSQVWSVQEKSTGNVFAVKAGRPYTGLKNRLRQLEEVSILRELSQIGHPHIIPYVDSWEHNSRLYIQTALAPCGDFSTFLLSLAEKGGLDEARAWKVLNELSDGLAHIHACNFIHLDMKPPNILITATGSLQIADFGLSTIISTSGAAEGVSPALPTAVDGKFVWEEQTGVAVPSPILDRELEGDREYLSPEALEETVGTGADVFAVGIMLLEATTNIVLPSNGDGWVKLRQDDFSDLDEHFNIRGQVQQRDTPSLPFISSELSGTIQHMMRSEPCRRATLDEVRSLSPLVRLSCGQSSTRAALVEEDETFLTWLLA